MFYIGARSRPPNPTTLRRNQKLGKSTRPTRGLNAQAHPNGPRAGPRHKRRSPSPHPTGLVSPSLTPRRWKDALVRYRSMCAPSKTPSASYRDSLPREGSRSFERGGRVSPAPRSSRLLDRLTSRAPVNRALRVTPANSNILRLQEPRRPTPDAGSPPRHCGVDGEPPHWEIFSPPDRLHKHKWDEQVGLPPPAPESRTFHRLPPPKQTKPKPKPHNRRWNIRLGRVRLWRTE